MTLPPDPPDFEEVEAPEAPLPKAPSSWSAHVAGGILTALGVTLVALGVVAIIGPLLAILLGGWLIDRGAE